MLAWMNVRSNTSTSTGTIVLENGSAQQDHGTSFGGFLASIEVGAFVALVEIGGFVILHKRSHRKWALRKHLSTVFHDINSENLSAIGLFRFLRLLTITFSVAALAIVPLLLPLNYVHHDQTSSAQGLDKFSCLNLLHRKTDRLWAHVIAAYGFTYFLCAAINAESDLIRNLEDKICATKSKQLYLLTDIPKFLDRGLVESMFQRLCAGQARVYAIDQAATSYLKKRPLDKVVAQIEQIVMCLDDNQDISSQVSEERLARKFEELRTTIQKHFRRHDCTRVAVLEIADSLLVCRIPSRAIWPLHAYQVDKDFTCVTWENARRSYLCRSTMNTFMAFLSIAASCTLALPVTFSASVGQIQTLAQHVSWLAWVQQIPPTAISYIQGVVPQLIVAAVVALVPSLLRQMSAWHCYVTHAEAEVAYHGYYSAYLFLQAFLLVSISSSLLVTLSEVARQPSSIPRVLALNLPKAGNYFISFLTLQGFSLFAETVAQWRFLIMKAFKRRVRKPTPRHAAALNAQEPFSISSMYSIIALLGVIGITYSIITPLALIPSTIGLLALLIAIKPALERFENQNTSVGAALFYNVINQLFAGLYIMQLCLAGVFISIQHPAEGFAGNARTILALFLCLLTGCFHCFLLRKRKRRYSTLFPSCTTQRDGVQRQSSRNQTDVEMIYRLPPVIFDDNDFVKTCLVQYVASSVYREIGQSRLQPRCLQRPTFETRNGIFVCLDRKAKVVAFGLQIALWVKQPRSAQSLAILELITNQLELIGIPTDQPLLFRKHIYADDEHDTGLLLELCL